jgi:hypothetical protein
VTTVTWLVHTVLPWLAQCANWGCNGVGLLLEKEVRSLTSDKQQKQCIWYLKPFSDPVCILYLLCCCSFSHAFNPQADFSFNMFYYYTKMY